MNKIQNLIEYIELASRTYPDLGSSVLNMFHMQSGIITEIGEAIDPIKKHIAYNKPLDMVNVGEEIADACWYIANRARVLVPKEFLNIVLDNDVEYQENLKSWKETFSSYFKDKSEIEKLISACTLMYLCAPTKDADLTECSIEDGLGVPQFIILHGISEELGLDFFQILTNNIAKLKVRYPDKFNNESAINRDLDAERTELER